VATTDHCPQALLYLGRSCHALGEPEKAARIFHSFLKQKPDSAAGHFFLGRSLIALGMYAQAARHLRVSIAANPKLAIGFGLLGFAYLKLRRPEKALEFFAKARELAPDNESLLAGYLNATLVSAIRLFYRGRLAEAGRLFREILRLRASSISPHLYLAAIYKELGKANLSLLHLDAAIEISPKDPVLRLQKAMVLLEQGKKNAAASELRAGSEILRFPTGVGGKPEEILRLITIRLFSEGRYREAIYNATRLLRISYDDPQLHGLVAEAYRNLGDFVKSRNHYQRAIEIEKDSVELRYGLFPVLWELGEYRELLSQTRKVLQKAPGDDLAMYFHGLALSKVGESLQETIAVLQEQIRLKGPDPLLMSALAGAYMRAGIPELAEGWFQRTLKVSKGDRDTFLSLAAIYESLDQKRKEADTYLRYLDLYPDDEGKRRVLLKVLLDLESYAEAAKEIVTLLPSSPGSSKLKSLLAFCYRRSGKYSDALLVLKDLLREKPDSVELVKAVVYCLDKMGIRNVAIQLIEGFMKSFRENLSLLLMRGVLHFQEREMEKSLEAFRRAISLAPKDWRAYRNMGMVYRKMGNMGFAETFLSRADEYRRAAGEGRYDNKGS
jgi:tetratricopeptide (TPR) repeat protein